MRIPPYKFVVLFFLYLAQAIPMAFFQTAMPVYLRTRGVDLATLGALAALALPAALRFLWAPLVDSKGIHRLGNYKSWIIPLQITTVLFMPLMTTFDWVVHFRIFLVFAFFMTLVGATQDTGVDGLAIRMLSREEKPAGAALSNFCVLLGTAIGGGVIVALFEKVGLDGSLWIMAGIYAMPLAVLLPYKEPPLDPSRKPASYGSLVAIFKRREVRLWMYQQTLLIAGIALGTGLLLPMLVDLGYTMTDFSLLQGVLFPIVGAVGTIAAPMAIRRFGRKTVIMAAASCLAVHLVDLILINLLHPPHLVTFALLSFLGFTNTFLFIGIYSVAMDLSSPESAATDWTVQSGVLGATGAVFGGLAGVVAQHFGYLTLLTVALVLDIVGISAVWRFFGGGYLSNGAAIQPLATASLDSAS